MFEDPSSQISKVQNLKYLTPIVLHRSIDKHYYISLLYRIPNPGSHNILCKRLRNMDILDEIPQLIEIMLLDVSSSPISYPVYDLLRFHARKDWQFRLTLFHRLKSVLSVVEDNKASYCYFMCCDILDIDAAMSMRNLGTLRLRYRCRNRRRKAARTFLIRRRPRAPTIYGLMLYLAVSVISVFKTPLFDPLYSFSRTFNSKKNFRNLQFKTSSTAFKANSIFLETLVAISSNLLKVPAQLRQRTLKIYLEILNREMSGSIRNPFHSSQQILRFSLEHAKTLDSAENAPYVVVCECGDDTVKRVQRSQRGLWKAKLLVKQIESLGDLGELGDVNEIKGSLVAALEDLLFNGTARRPDIYNRIGMEDRGGEALNIERPAGLDTRAIDFNFSAMKHELGYDPAATVVDDSIISVEDVGFEILTTNHEYDELVLTHEHVNTVKRDREEQAESTRQEERVLARSTEKSSSEIRKRIRATSAYSSHPGWGTVSFIVKSGNVLKHEYLAYQVLTQMKEIFEIEGLPIYIRNYRIILVSDTSGLVETVCDALSIHRIKSETKFRTLQSYFRFLFEGERMKAAMRNFLFSLVGYSLASYVLQIKDRHNGNILIDDCGHIVHVDFGFTFGMHPGIISVENAPFKFSAEYLELINIDEFRVLFVQGFIALRKHKEKLTRLVEIMQDSGYFEKNAFVELVDRLKLRDSEGDLEVYCNWLIDRSMKSMRTMFYDQFQYLSNGYL